MHPRTTILRFMCLLTLAVSAPGAPAQKVYTYVGTITSHSVLLAWGTTSGSGNTIGLDSVPLGNAEVRIDGRALPARRNWLLVEDLKPDTQYNYEIRVDGRVVGAGHVRTYPERAEKLAFFVLGDWGNGSRDQYRIAEALQREFEKRKNTDNPVRFVLTTGDNIYGRILMPWWRYSTGNEDSEWEKKFFRPYELLLRSIPFYPSPGNHDGNNSEARGDLPVYLDNFFFPGQNPARFYQFNFGGLAEFFALDTTSNSLAGAKRAMYTEDGAQFHWMQRVIPESKAPWKIAYFHHPPFNAGPRHKALHEELNHFVRLFAQAGVRAVFTGHEHNFQVAERTADSGDVLYVVSGAGGELRDGDIRSRMRAAGIAAWAAQHHFLLVEIERHTMRITPLGYEPIVVRNPDGRLIPLPIEVKWP